MAQSLVIGSGGLLGHAVSRELVLHQQSSDVIRPVVSWREKSVALRQLTDAVSLWMTSDGSSQKQLFWCAGVGTLRGDPRRIEDELYYLQVVLRAIESLAPTTGNANIKIFFASSAGGVYGDTKLDIATETTEPKPITDYGRTKLQLEIMLRQFADLRNASVVIGRIASLYGSHQDLSKRQGLISHLANSLARSLPIQIFTSTSTTRNYLDALSAARVAVSQMQLAQTNGVTLRNICSPFNVSVSELISLCRQIAGRRVVVNYVGGTIPDNSRIGTHFSNEVESLTRTTIAEGFASLVAAARLSMANSGP